MDVPSLEIPTQGRPDDVAIWPVTHSHLLARFIFTSKYFSFSSATWELEESYGQIAHTQNLFKDLDVTSPKGYVISLVQLIVKGEEK